MVCGDATLKRNMEIRLGMRQTIPRNMREDFTIAFLETAPEWISANLNFQIWSELFTEAEIAH